MGEPPNVNRETNWRERFTNVSGPRIGDLGVRHGAHKGGSFAAIRVRLPGASVGPGEPPHALQ